MTDRPLIIAHRGSSVDAPENTMAAFSLAREQGADMIELDVQPTADGTLVVFHDDTTARWNGRPDPVGVLPWSELQRLDIKGEPLPTFEELCRWAARVGMVMNVEIKVPGIEREVLAMLRAHQLQRSVVISSFHPEALGAVLRLDPEVKRGFLQGAASFTPHDRLRRGFPLRTLRRYLAWSWHPAYRLPFLPQLCRSMRQRGYRVMVWTVDDLHLWRRLIGFPVDGIITNQPALLRHVLQEAGGVTDRSAARMSWIFRTT